MICVLYNAFWNCKNKIKTFFDSFQKIQKNSVSHELDFATSHERISVI